MFKIISLSLLIWINISIAAAGASAGSGEGSPYKKTLLDTNIKKLKDLSPNPYDLILVVGSNPHERLDDRERLFLYVHPKIYTLGKASLEAAETAESRWFDVDFNDPAQMEYLANNLAGKFKIICFDVSVWKYFKEWNNLGYFRQLLADDGVLYVPHPVEAIFYPHLVDPDSMSPGDREKLRQSLMEGELSKIKQHFTDNGFETQMARGNLVKNLLVKALFEQSPHAPKSPMDVMIGVKAGASFGDLIAPPISLGSALTPAALNRAKAKDVGLAAAAVAIAKMAARGGAGGGESVAGK